MKVIDEGKIMDLSNFFNNLSALKIITSILDILTVWCVPYLLITVFKGTKAVQLLKGMLFIVIGQQVSRLLSLTVTSKLFSIMVQWDVLALIVIFQPGTERALEQLGRGSLLKHYTNTYSHGEEKLIQSVLEAVQHMAERRIETLVVFEKRTGLQDYIEAGISISSTISQRLLINIFIPNTPLRDGAMIIQDAKIAGAACHLPLSGSNKISKSLGMRHRAVIGVSEAPDSSAVIVSEETGSISITFDGRLRCDVSDEVFRELLAEYWFGARTQKKDME